MSKVCSDSSLMSFNHQDRIFMVAFCDILIMIGKHVRRTMHIWEKLTKKNANRNKNNGDSKRIMNH